MEMLTCFSFLFMFLAIKWGWNKVAFARCQKKKKKKVSFCITNIMDFFFLLEILARMAIKWTWKLGNLKAV